MCAPRASASTSSGCAYSRSIRSRTRRSRARSLRCCAAAVLLVTCEILPQSRASAALLEREHNAPDLVAAVDPAMRFDDLREWQHRIDHGLQHSTLAQRHEVSIAVGADGGILLAGADRRLLPGCGEHLPQIGDDHQEAAARFQ